MALDVGTIPGDSRPVVWNWKVDKLEITMHFTLENLTALFPGLGHKVMGIYRTWTPQLAQTQTDGLCPKSKTKDYALVLETAVLCRSTNENRKIPNVLPQSNNRDRGLETVIISHQWKKPRHYHWSHLENQLLSWWLCVWHNYRFFNHLGRMMCTKSRQSLWK